MDNSISNLNVKEQFILREVIKNGCLNSLTRYNYDKLKEWNKMFDQHKNDKPAPSTTAYHTWDRIQIVIRKMVAKKILGYETFFLKADLSPSGKQMQVRTYTIKPYYRTQNSFELKQFTNRFATKLQQKEIAANIRKGHTNVKVTR